MKKLLQVTRESAGSHAMLYLRYAEDDAVAKTLTLTDDGAVAVDLDSVGSVVGVELINPSNDDFALLVSVAKDRDLSLDGLFSFA